MIWLQCALLLFLSVTEQTDSENHEPTYKFGIIAGEPESLNGSSSVTVESFEECVQKCEADDQCILASQVADGEPCNLFPYGSVCAVKNNASGGEGQVAFRVYTDQPACELNLPLLLNGRTYPLYPNNTQESLWKIDTSEDGWTITYIDRIVEDNLVCGNWSFNRPYADGCDSNCSMTMVQIFAQPGPTLLGKPMEAVVGSWEECMTNCYNNFYCVIAHLVDGSTNCTMYQVGDLSLLDKKTATDGTRMVIKLPLTNKSCSYTTEQLLNGNYYLPYPRIATGMRRIFFTVITTEKYYKVLNYLDETGEYYNDVLGCPMYFMPNANRGLLKVESGMCFQPFTAPGITQPKAKEVCEEFGGMLFDERVNGILNDTSGMRFYTYYFLNLRWGVQGKMWFGLEKDQECVGADLNTTYCYGKQSWQWSNPSWLTIYQWPGKQTEIAMSWASGEPVESPNKKCAYFQLNSAAPMGYAFYTADCESTEMDGFVCGVPTQMAQGIKPYADVLAEYGGTAEFCCGYG